MQPDLGFCSSVCIYLCNVVLSCPFIPLPPLSHACITHGAVIIAAVISFLCFCMRIFHDVSTLQLSCGSNFSIWPPVFVDMMEEVSQSAEIRGTCWGANKMFLFGSPVCANRQIVGWSFLPCDSCQKFLIYENLGGFVTLARLINGVRFLDILVGFWKYVLMDYNVHRFGVEDCFSLPFCSQLRSWLFALYE